MAKIKESEDLVSMVQEIVEKRERRGSRSSSVGGTQSSATAIETDEDEDRGRKQRRESRESDMSRGTGTGDELDEDGEREVAQLAGKCLELLGMEKRGGLMEG